MSYFYVISPVGADLQFAVKKAILEELGRNFACEPFFPLERHREFVISTCCADIQKADFVLADLSQERPSCYFELGVAEALNAQTAIVAAVGTRIHQVADANRIFWYTTLDEYRSLVSTELSRRAGTTSHLLGQVKGAP